MMFRRIKTETQSSQSMCGMDNCLTFARLPFVALLFYNPLEIGTQSVIKS